MKVRDAMTREVVWVAPTAPLREVAELMLGRGVSGLPVRDADGACVGVISEADLLAKHLSRPIGRRTPLEWILGDRPDEEDRRRRDATTAAQAMSSPAITIDADRPLRDAAAVMVEHGINRLPVMSGDDLVGIVTRADLVAAYLHRDLDILTAVRQDVLRHTMWLDPDGFEIDVSDGIVAIAGRVDRRSTATIVKRLIGLIEGVVDVRSSIAWELDDRHLQDAVETDHEPGAASLVAREHPQPMHR